MEENLQEQGAVPSQGKPTHTALLPYLPTLSVCSLWTQPDNAQLLRHPACRDLRRSNILLYESKRHCQLYHVLQDAEESVRKRRCKALLKVWRRNTTTHSASVRLHVTKQRRSSKRMEWGNNFRSCSNFMGTMRGATEKEDLSKEVDRREGRKCRWLYFRPLVRAIQPCISQKLFACLVVVFLLSFFTNLSAYILQDKT